jgi:hypothetical protein
MPDLSQSLQGRDLGHLRIVAELWGIEFSAPDTRVGLQRLAPLLLDESRIREVLADLPPEARTALDGLLLNGGRLPWPLFTQRYGEVREMGAARRDRERPYLKPVSPAETLWYRALAARSFFDTPDGPQEFVYIPEDLLAYLPSPQTYPSTPLGRPATPIESAYPILAADRILDHTCTLLAALRLGFSEDAIELASAGWMGLENRTPYPFSPHSLRGLLSAAALVDEKGLPLAEPVRTFLESSRGGALILLVRAWRESPLFNDLRMIPHLRCEGEWDNDPLTTRNSVLKFISHIPASKWWSLTALVSAVREAHPNFQRPAGDYDSWFIRDESRGGAFLRGFEHWDDVEGELIRFIIAGPMYWLGLVDLATPNRRSNGELDAGVPSPSKITAFRFTNWAERLLSGEVPGGLPEEREPILVRSDAQIRIPRLAPRAARYQLSRFCAWEADADDVYNYRITPASLARAKQQGLTANQLITLLHRYSKAAPPTLLKALERWQKQGVEARLEKLVVLRLSSPKLLQAVRNSKAGRFLGDPLGPTTVVIRSGAWQKVLVILAEMGYLGEASLED